MAKTVVKTTTPNWENRTLFHKDNLDVLREMNSETVDLIATDPPFKKGRDFHATPDSLSDGASFQDRWSWEEHVHPSWLDKLEDDWSDVASVIKQVRISYGEDMAAFLCFMAVRLIEMHRVLKPTGSIYLHCDPTACHYLKMLLDVIFGKKNFRNEIIWYYPNSGLKAKSKKFHQVTDNILYYLKDINAPFCFNHVHRKRKDGQSKQAKRKFNSITKKADMVRDENGKIIYIIRDEVLVNSLWELPSLSNNKKESTGYPTQKPLPLYQRIIKASSNKGDIVLDPFCGCATTLVAAEIEGREWVGIDIWKEAHKVVVNRLEKEGLLKDKGSSKVSTLAFGETNYTTKLPKRTDDKKEAVPFLQTKEVMDEPKGKKMSRDEMLVHLIKQNGCKCQGCNRMFDDSRYLELDHNTPRSDGGINHITNRVLLCSPCNKLKSNILTLSGLKKENKKLGYMQGDE